MDTFLFNRNPPSEVVLRARNVAGQCLERLFAQYNKGVSNKFECFTWLKTELTAPSFEHLTFSYKNAVFPILIDVIADDGNTLSQSERRLLCDEAVKYNLVPCIYEVRIEKNVPDVSGVYDRKVAGMSGYRLSPVAGGWNLKHARTGNNVDPCYFGRDNSTPMSEWELQNFAIGIARQYGVEKNGYVFDSFCDIPGIDPQLWFHDQSGRRSWAIVRFQKVLDESDADKFRDFVDRNKYLAGYDGYFVPVSAAMADAAVYDQHGNVIPLSRRFDGSAPLYRGHGMYVNYRRMIPIYKA